jgi:uncharacterized protein (DUF433 family)
MDSKWAVDKIDTSCEVSRDPEVMGGAPVFRGTRVPVRILLEHIAAGETIDDFLDGFPSVKREQVVAFLERAAALAVDEAA